MEKEFKEVSAEVSLTVDVECPECEWPIDIRQTLNDREAWIPNQLSIPICEVEIKCPKCKEQFLVTQVNF